MPLVKKTVGIILIAIGLLALLTPLTPGAWLAIIGLELIGIRLAFVDKIKEVVVRRRAQKEHLSVSKTPSTQESDEQGG